MPPPAPGAKDPGTTSREGSAAIRTRPPTDRHPCPRNFPGGDSTLRVPPGPVRREPVWFRPLDAAGNDRRYRRSQRPDARSSHGSNGPVPSSRFAGPRPAPMGEAIAVRRRESPASPRPRRPDREPATPSPPPKPGEERASALDAKVRRAAFARGSSSPGLDRDRRGPCSKVRAAAFLRATHGDVHARGAGPRRQPDQATRAESVSTVVLFQQCAMGRSRPWELLSSTHGFASRVPFPVQIIPSALPHFSGGALPRGESGVTSG